MTTSKDIEQQTQEFLDNGGSIEVVPAKSVEEIIQETKEYLEKNKGHAIENFSED
jgi:hypothetical protein